MTVDKKKTNKSRTQDNNKSGNIIDRSKEHFNTNPSFNSQDPTGSYTGKPDPDISDTPVQDADDL